MAVNDVLSQEEIDALLHGVDAGSVETETDAGPTDEPTPFDFASHDRIVRGRLPTLEMITERFARLFRIGLFHLLRRSAEVTAGTVRMLKFSEYVHGLYVPTSLNLVKVKPLRGTGLIVLDPKLVFVIVDNFFGGDGRYHAAVEGREFTATERRLIQIVVEQVFKDMQEAWSSVYRIEFEYINMEVNPQFANVVGPTEVVVTTSFDVELEGGGGEMHLTLPYSMIEPIREQLDAGFKSERSDVDLRWIRSLRDEVLGAQIEVKCNLTETTLSLGEVLHMRKGDVIQVEIPEKVSLFADNIPVLRGYLGTHNGQSAVKISEHVQHPQD